MLTFTVIKKDGHYLDMMTGTPTWEDDPENACYFSTEEQAENFAKMHSLENYTIEEHEINF